VEAWKIFLYVLTIEWSGAMPLLIKKQNVAPCIADAPFFISSNVE
jgi:hypothetical protein